MSDHEDDRSTWEPHPQVMAELERERAKRREQYEKNKHRWFGEDRNARRRQCQRRRNLGAAGGASIPH